MLYSRLYLCFVDEVHGFLFNVVNIFINLGGTVWFGRGGDEKIMLCCARSRFDVTEAHARIKNSYNTLN